MTSPRKSRDPNTLRPATQLIHGGTLRSRFEETSEALFLTQGYLYDTMEIAEARFKGEEPGFVYSRFSNPTVAMFEKRMALIEGAEAARATASGMAAVTAALMGQVKAGDHVVAARALFGSCLYVVEDLLPRFGVEFDAGRGNRPRPMAGGGAAEHQNRLPRIADQPDARDHRHRRGRRDPAWRGRDAGGRQRVRDAAPPASPEARRRRRRLFGDQAHRRPGPGARRGDPRQRAIHRRQYPQLFAPDRPEPVAVQRLDAAEIAGDAADPRRGAGGVGGADRRRAREASRGRRARSTPAAPIIRRPSSRAGRCRAAARCSLSRSRAARRRRSAWRTRSRSSASRTISATPRA